MENCKYLEPIDLNGDNNNNKEKNLHKAANEIYIPATVK